MIDSFASMYSAIGKDKYKSIVYSENVCTEEIAKFLVHARRMNITYEELFSMIRNHLLTFNAIPKEVQE